MTGTHSPDFPRSDRIGPFVRRCKKKPGTGRAAVGRKRTGLSILTGLFALMMLFQAFGMSAMAIRGYGRGVERDAYEAGEVDDATGDAERDRIRDEVYRLHPDLRDMRFSSRPAPERMGRLYVSLAGLLTVLIFGIFFLLAKTGRWWPSYS